MAATARQNKRKRTAWTIVLAIASIVLVVALVALGVMWYSYFQGRQKYDGVEKIASTESLETALIAEEDIERIHVDWDSLRAANPDTVAWVYVPGTDISYPVVKGHDNYYYLTHDFDGDAGWLANYGSIFLDCENNPDWSDASYFIYGHHMNDGSMFAALVDMADQSYFDAHRTVYLLSPQGNFCLRGFAVVHCAPEEEIVMHAFDSATEQKRYVQDKIDRSQVVAKDTPAAADMKKTFAFATCDNESWGRYILYCYPVRSDAAGLSGSVGIDEEEGKAAGFAQSIEEDRY